jgi:hypothetical protein
MKLVKAVITLVVLWALAILTVYLLKGWGPVEGLVKYTGQGAYLTAGGLLAGVVIMLLVLMYILGKILSWIPKLSAISAQLLNIPRIFLGQ